jgi:hypothetical protein
MKKIAFLMTLLVLPFLVNAQKSPIDKLFKKYYGKEGFTSVLVHKEAFEVIAKMEKSEGEIEGSLGKIDRVRVIAQEDESEEMEGINFLEELKGIEFGDYKELVVVKESDQEVLILAKEDGGKLAELLILVGGEENVLVSIEGRFTMEDLEALSEIEELEDIEELEEIFN